MSDFETEFLENYLKFGLGSMSKSEIDALVMHLLDKHGYSGSGPLTTESNQTVSVRLKTPVGKIKRLRYDAALKFGEKIEEQAKGRLLAALGNASLEPDGEKICLIIEDSLAKNWLQGELKLKQSIFDYSFNTEIVKVSASALFEMLEKVFDKKSLEAFKEGYIAAKKQKNAEARRDAFKRVALNFAEGAAKVAGGGVVAILKAHLGSI